MTVEKVKIQLSLGATVAINDHENGWTDWLRPSASAEFVFQGIPSEEEFRSAVKFMQTQMVEPTLDEVLQTVHERLLAKGQRGS